MLSIGEPKISCVSTEKYSCVTIYLVECINCKCPYVGSPTSFKRRFLIHKSDIKTKIDSGGTARHFNSICCQLIQSN